MGKTYFYCHNACCLEGRQLLEYVRQELSGKRLCRGCYDGGLRLKMGVMVIMKNKSKIGDKEAE